MWLDGAPFLARGAYRSRRCSLLAKRISWASGDAEEGGEGTDEGDEPDEGEPEGLGGGAGGFQDTEGGDDGGDSDNKKNDGELKEGFERVDAEGLEEGHGANWGGVLVGRVGDPALPSVLYMPRAQGGAYSLGAFF